LNVLRKSVVQVIDNYYDPQRIEPPRAMTNSRRSHAS